MLEQVGGYDEGLRNGQDYDRHLRIGREYRFVWQERSLAFYRRSGTNISSRPITQLIPSRVAVLQRLLSLPLTSEQEHTVRDWIALNYQALGYEYGDREQLGASLRAYYQAYKNRSDLALLRGMAVSLAKSVMVGRRQTREERT